MTIEACLFPGQGLPAADIIGFYSKLGGIDPQVTSRKIAQAQEALNRVHGVSEFNVLDSLADPASPSFKKTSFVQPVIYALSMTAYDLAREHHFLNPAVVAGHSLGEYAAITAAGVITYEEGLDLVTNRGLFMQGACDKNPSTLVLLMGVSLETAEKICLQSAKGVCPEGSAQTALINAPDIIAVGCAEKSASTVEQMAKLAGAKKTLSLNTAGAFHTKYMEEAAERMLDLLDKYSLGMIQIPIVANLSGAILESDTYSASNLVRSMTRPVQWSHTVFTLRLIADKFIEVGPGNSLQVLNGRNGISKEQTANVLDCFVSQLVG